MQSLQVTSYSMQTIAGTSLLRSLPSNAGCQTCIISMAAPKPCSPSYSQRLPISSSVGSTAYLQPRKKLQQMRHPQQRLAPSRAAVVCTLRNFDWPEVLPS